jgi:hypothetical protein
LLQNSVDNTKFQKITQGAEVWIISSPASRLTTANTHQQSWGNVKCYVVVVTLGHEDRLSWPIKHKQDILRLCWSWHCDVELLRLESKQICCWDQHMCNNIIKIVFFIILFKSGENNNGANCQETWLLTVWHNTALNDRYKNINSKLDTVYPAS